MLVHLSREVENILEAVTVVCLSKLCVHLVWTNEEYDGARRVLPFLGQKGHCCFSSSARPDYWLAV